MPVYEVYGRGGRDGRITAAVSGFSVKGSGRVFVFSVNSDCPAKFVSSWHMERTHAR